MLNAFIFLTFIINGLVLKVSGRNSNYNNYKLIIIIKIIKNNYYNYSTFTKLHTWNYGIIYAHIYTY